jgi:hypothetical protein
MEIKRTNVEIDQLLDWAADAVSEGETYHLDKSYEEGVLETLEYLRGVKSSPMDGITVD